MFIFSDRFRERVSEWWRSFNKAIYDDIYDKQLFLLEKVLTTQEQSFSQILQQTPYYPYGWALTQALSDLVSGGNVIESWQIKRTNGILFPNTPETKVKVYKLNPKKT